MNKAVVSVHLVLEKEGRVVWYDVSSLPVEMQLKGKVGLAVF